MPRPPAFSVLVVVAVLFVPSLSAAPLSQKAIELRNLGLAQLENEQAEPAETTFRQLVKIAADDPLPYANLAVAALRQQKSEEALRWIGQALAKAPGRADLLTIQGDIFQWSGREDEALAAYRKAAAAAPGDPEVQYALYRQASSTGDEAAMAESLGRLARLRPENLVVLLQSGQRAVRAGDRAGATRAFLRVRELLWQAPEAATAALDQVLGALEKGDAAAARGPATRLENVLKPTPAYQQSLRELFPGVQALPVERFADEPPPAEFGEPVPVRFLAVALAGNATSGGALAVGDFDGDERPDLARVPAGGASPSLEVRRAASGWKPVQGPAASGITGLVAADLDNDGRLDLIGHGPRGVSFWKGKGDGSFEEADAGLGEARGAAAAVLDFDLEGDLDLVVAGGERSELYRNALQGPLEAIGRQALPGQLLNGAGALAASDLDRDGDPDLAVAHGKGIAWIDNLRQGKLADRTASGGLGQSAPATAVASADLDNDGLPDLIAASAAGQGLALWRNRGSRFEPWRPAGLPAGRFVSVIAFDGDNDGRLDLAAAGPGGLVLLAQRRAQGRLVFRPFAVEGARGATALAAADLDADGDLDLVAAGPAGLHRLENQGGNRNHWLAVRLRGLSQGNGKNNLHGLGATLELRAGSAYQFREVTGQVTHLGLGQRRQADLLRVVWTNGVPQNRIQPRGDQRVVEEQVLKGSCPFLYTWDGERFAFVTDLLWNAPIGLPVAAGKWVGADPEELVRVDGARAAGGVYRLRVTEELWEAAYFDVTRLWVVDHPAEVEVASSLRVVPGSGEKGPDRVLASRGLRPVSGAWDGTGAEVTDRVRARDEIYAAGYPSSPYQGVAGEPWSFTFDLGEAPGRPLRLHLDGWIFPADASLNLASSQRRDLAYVPPRLEVETASGWEVLAPAIGHPAGKTKTLVVETPPLPPGARRLRIVSTLWLAWDRLAWTTATADEAPAVRARLLPASADLRYRGFSEMLRRGPNAPHGYDYERVSEESPWLPFPGRYTRYGDVRELLTEPDDRTVILAPGDEIDLAFDASGLPPVPEGWVRTVFLESQGWDKDADRNTWEAQQMEPLPFRAMSGYPYAPGESYPDTPELREYRERWLTREVGIPNPPSLLFP
jgi:Flp pilus assembly protein TadD